jgi:ActR/RegA family two-component response regulator
MDYWMSNLNGATACRNIVAKHPNARVILVSGWLPLKDVSACGAIAVLAKPVDLDHLYNALHAASQPAASRIPRPLPVLKLRDNLRWEQRRCTVV